MTTFTVWKFDDPDGAAHAEASLKAAAGEGLVTIVDHALMSWPADADKPELHHQHDGPKRGAAWGALWGILGGALFAIPVAGVVLGAGVGALAKATAGTGITKDDLERIRTEVTPGTSALPRDRGRGHGPARRALPPSRQPADLDQSHRGRAGDAAGDLRR